MSQKSGQRDQQKSPSPRKTRTTRQLSATQPEGEEASQASSSKTRKLAKRLKVLALEADERRLQNSVMVFPEGRMTRSTRKLNPDELKEQKIKKKRKKQTENENENLEDLKQGGLLVGQGSQNVTFTPALGASNPLKFLIPVGLVLIGIAIYFNPIPDEHGIPFCNTDFAFAEGNPCTQVQAPGGIACRICPLNAICDNRKLVGCQEGFKQIKGDLCLSKKSNPSEEHLLVFLATIDEGIQNGMTFQSFGAEHENYITGQELLDLSLLKDTRDHDVDSERERAIAAIGDLLDSMTSIGKDRYCMSNRFSTERMGNAFNFTELTEVQLTSVKLGPLLDKNSADGETN